MQNAHVVAYHKAKAVEATATAKAYSMSANAQRHVSLLMREVGQVERDYHNALAQIETRKARSLFRPIVIK